MYAPLQLFVAEYFTTALGMPFEVGKTLLQVEYRPRKRFVEYEEGLEELEEVKERDWGAEEDAVSPSWRVPNCLSLGHEPAYTQLMAQ